MATADAIAAIDTLADHAASDPRSAARTLGLALLAVGDAVAAAKKRITELEKCPVEYLGTFEIGKNYERRQLVTCAGSLWYCERTTQQRPGDSNAWTLCAKRGADGKDAK